MRRSKEEAMQTRERIVQTALECFSTRGYAMTSFADIGALNNFTKGAVFWHFKSKEELLAEIIRRMHTEYEPLKGIADATSLDEVKTIFMNWAHELTTNPKQQQFFRFMISRVEWSEALKKSLKELLDQTTVRDPFLELQRCLKQLKARREVVTPLSEESIVSLFSMTFFGAFREAWLREQPIDVFEVLSAGLDFIIQGIRSK